MPRLTAGTTVMREPAWTYWTRDIACTFTAKMPGVTVATTFFWGVASLRNGKGFGHFATDVVSKIFA